MGAQNSKKRLSPTVSYLLTAIAAGLPAAIAGTLALPFWKAEESLAPYSLAAIHLTILGLLMTVAFGVLYQIVPIAFQAPPMPRHVVRWHLPAHILSVIAMIYGFYAVNDSWVGWGGVAFTINTAAYLLFSGRSYLLARNHTPVYRQLVWPVLALLSVLSLGIVQAFAKGQVSPRVVLSHILLGGFGFWGGLALILSYKLIPMFALSHGYHAHLARVSALYFASLGIDVLGQLLGLRNLVVTGIFIDALALIGFVTDMVRILAARKRKRIVLPLQEALVALGFNIVGQWWILIGWTLHSPQAVLQGAFVFLYLGLIPMALAYMQKMVPFLWFEYRFSKSPDRKTAPLIDEMVPKRPALTGILAYYAGATCGAVDLLSQPDSAAAPLEIAGLLRILFVCGLFCGFLLFLYIFRVVLTTGGPRPAEDNQSSSRKP